MANEVPTLDEWRRLYAAAGRVKEMAPWTWMKETDIFGVQDPETGTLGFVSVMGAQGEHFAVAVYLRAEGLYHFWSYQVLGSKARVEDMLSIPQLHASFENRDQLSDQDRQVIEELGLKFREEQAWPLFQSYRPGYMPWFLEPGEARFLTIALEQLLEVAPRFRADAALFPPPYEERYLVRVSRSEGEAVLWEDSIVPVPQPEARPIQITIDPADLNAVERLPREGSQLEMDCAMILSGMQEERGARPVFPYLLMAVDAGSGLILDQNMLAVKTTPDALWAEVPGHVLHLLLRIGRVPGEIAMRSPQLFNVLTPLAGRLKIRLVPARRLPALERAWQSVLGFMQR